MASPTSLSRWLAVLAAVACTSSPFGAQSVTVHFDNRPTVLTARFRTSGLTVTPELNLPLMRLTIFNGLGVADTFIDPGESVLFALDQPATGVSYAVQSANDTDGNGEAGETDVEGYGAGGEWLGTVEIYGLTSRDISTPFSSQPLSAIRVRPREPIRISSMSFNPVRKTRPPQTQIVE